MISRKSLAIVLFFFCHTNLNAQNDTLQPSSAIIVEDARMGLSDVGRVLTSPLHFSAQAWSMTALVVGSTAFLFTLDKPVRMYALEHQNQTASDVFTLGREYGSGVNALIFAGGLYTGGLVFKNKDVRTTGLMVFESVGISGSITWALKVAFGRSRPYLEEGVTTFHGFQFKEETTSLPSGHSTVAFAISSVLAGRLHNIYASIGLYSLAALTAGSRIYNDDHWLSDTFLGAAIGTSVGIAVVRLHQDEGDHSSIHLTPLLHGVNIAFIF